MFLLHLSPYKLTFFFHNCLRTLYTPVSLVFLMLARNGVFFVEWILFLIYFSSTFYSTSMQFAVPFFKGWFSKSRFVRINCSAKTAPLDVYLLYHLISLLIKKYFYFFSKIFSFIPFNRNRNRLIISFKNNIGKFDCFIFICSLNAIHQSI